MGDIAISSGIRSNLSALRSTTSLIESTQNKLATGNRVNSALDNPANFFTASSMNNRAGDLGSLLDSMSTGTSTIKAADNALTSITSLVESAQGAARQALQDATGEKEASIVGGTSLGGATSRVSGEDKKLVGDLEFDAGDSITVTTTKDGVPSETTITIDETTTIKDLTKGISSGLSGKVNAEVTPDGKLSVTASNGASLDITVNDAAGGAKDNNLQDLFGTTATINGTADQIVTGAAGVDVAALTTALADATTAKTGADDAITANEAANGGDLAFLEAAKTTAIDAEASLTAPLTTAEINTALDTATTDLTTATDAVVDPNAITVAEQDAIDAAQTKVTNITAARDASVLVDGRVALDADLATKTTAVTTATDALAAGQTSDAISEKQTITAPATDANGTREKLAAQFNELLSQITDLAEDADFNGINLLKGDDLKVTFNEKTGSNENTLTIKGVTLDASGLGLDAVTGNFQSDADIETSLTQIKDSLTTLRQQASEFGSKLAVVETRQDFTMSMIDTLEEGASDLTLADINKEGANMLALQTRQQLASTTMGIANQNDQAILSFLR